MIKLTDKFRQSRGSWLMTEIEQAIEDRKPLDAKLELIRSLYWMDKEPLQGPWDGASDIHLPVLYEKIETAVPKMVAAFWGTEPVVHVRRVPSEFLPEQTDAAERMINWGIAEDITPRFYDTTESWFRNALRDGQSVVKIYWRREWEKTVEVHRIKTEYRAGQPTPYGTVAMDNQSKAPDDILIEIFGLGTTKHGIVDVQEEKREDTLGDHPYDGMAFTVDFIEDRRRHSAYVVLRSSEFVDEIDVHVYRHVLKHDRPCVEVVEHEDLIVPYRTTELQEADWVAQQYWLTKAEVRKRYNEGIFEMTEEEFQRLMDRRAERVEELETNEELKRQKDRVIGEGVKEQRHQTAALDDGEEDQSTDNNKMLFFEVYVRDDIDGDEDPVEVIYHVSYDLRTVVGCSYLTESFPHGRRPFAPIKYKSISGRWYGQGMGEVLVPINLEVNTIINYVNNNQELINNPFFFYIPAATIVDPAVLKNVSPGDGIPIGDINGVMFPKFPQEPLANLSALDSLLLFADRVTISPMVAGSPQVRNAPRTARGTTALLSEGNIQLDNIITRWQRTGWEELMHQVLGLYQSFMPQERYIYVTGDNGVLTSRRVTPQEIRGRYMFGFTGNTVNTNREILRSIAQVRYNTIMTHPDMAMDPMARREALMDLLRHFSEGVDITRLVPSLPGQGSYQHPPMSQQSENQAMMHGIQLDALPTDDHAGHLMVLEQFQRSPAFQTLPESHVILFAMHMKQHVQYMQQQQSSGQQPVSPGMGNNVPTGMTQNGGTDFDALEGGVQ